jgi:MerR family mercuric resistance operon transcriptional regulator
MTIGRLAAAADVGVETVRYYQRRGLLALPERADLYGGVRRYGEGDVQRLRFIRAAQGAGFTLEQIGGLLALDAMDDRAKARTLAAEQIATLDARIAALTGARDALARLAHDCAEGGAGPCPILTAFEAA